MLLHHKDILNPIKSLTSIFKRPRFVLCKKKQNTTIDIIVMFFVCNFCPFRDAALMKFPFSTSWRIDKFLTSSHRLVLFLSFTPAFFQVKASLIQNALSERVQINKLKITWKNLLVEHFSKESIKRTWI